MIELWDFCIVDDKTKAVHIANVEPMPLDTLTVFRSKFLTHGRRFMNVPAGQLGAEFADYLLIFYCAGDGHKIGADRDYYNSNRMIKDE